MVQENLDTLISASTEVLAAATGRLDDEKASEYLEGMYFNGEIAFEALPFALPKNRVPIRLPRVTTIKRSFILPKIRKIRTDSS